MNALDASDLPYLYGAVVDLVAMGVWALYTVRDVPGATYLLWTDKGDGYYLAADGAPVGGPLAMSLRDAPIVDVVRVALRPGCWPIRL